MEYRAHVLPRGSFLAAADAERSLVLEFEYSVGKLILDYLR